MILEHLRELRTSWGDEIPDKIIHSDSPDNKYKVRKNGFVGAKADMFNLLDDGILSDATRRTAAEAFLKRFSSGEFIEKPTTAEDIRVANSLIDIVLAEKTGFLGQEQDMKNYTPAAGKFFSLAIFSIIHGFLLADKRAGRKKVFEILG